MIDDERPDAPQEGDAPEEAASDAGGGAETGGGAEEAQPTPSADPGESPAAGDEPLTGVEDEAEEITEAPDAGAAEEPAPAEPAAEEPAPAEPAPDEPVAEEPAPPEPAADEPAAEEPAPEEPAADEPAAAGDQPSEPDRPRRDRREREGGEEKEKEEVVPGAHLEPDLVLDEARAQADVDEYADRYAQAGDEGETAPDGDATHAPAGDAPAESPAPRSALDLAADARYRATGKRKTSVARVILRPGDGAYSVNGRSLEDYFPRAALQKAARQPLQTAGFEKRMDVVAKIHGGGVSAQAGALRHGVARALVEADPSLRAELKRRGFLSRDARAKERKKAGLKKARKRPQFSKR